MSARSITRIFGTILVSVSIALLLAPPLFGQATNVSQSVTGIVADESGAAIPVASVTVRNSDTGVKTTSVTTKEGYFSFPNLPIGTYSVTVSAKGFKTAVTENVRALVGVSPNLSITLAVGSISQSVTVSENTAAIDTTSSTMGDTRTIEEIAELPVQVSGGTRSAISYVQYMGGVVNTQYGSGGYSLINGTGDAGGFGTLTSIRMDGIYASSQQTQSFSQRTVVPDLVQEVRLVTNTNAEYGWDLGSSLDLVTKSGTNRFHGSVYEYARNEAFDARNWFAASRGPNKEHDFGVIFSGPIVKNKHFFIFNYSGYRKDVAATGQVVTVPTAKMQNGDFSELLGQQIGTDALGRPVFSGEIYDPATTRPDGQGGFIRDPFTFNGQLNAIDPARFSSVSSFYAKEYPQPNRPGIALNWVGSAIPANYEQDNLYIKTDHDFGHHRVSFAWELTPRGQTTNNCSSIFGPALVGWGPDIVACGSLNSREWNFRTNYTWAPRPDLLFGVHLGFLYTKSTTTLSQANLNSGGRAGLKGTFEPGTPVVNISDIQGFGSVTPQVLEAFLKVPVNVDLTWIKGGHQFKFGAQFLDSGSNLTIGFNGNGNFSFGPNETNLPDFSSQVTGRGTGAGFASFLLGSVDSGIVGSQLAQDWRDQAWAWYAQDQWRVTPKLTLSYGLRWDLFLSPKEAVNRIGTFDPSLPNPAAGGRLGALTFWGDGPGRNGRQRLLDTYPWALGPRLGIAYQWNPQTVVRIYYGIQRYPLNSVLYDGRWIPNYGWGATLTTASANNGVTPAFSNWDNGTFTLPTFPTLDPSYLNGSGLAYVDPRDDKPGPEQDFGVAIEREVPGGIMLRAKYAGKLQHGIPTNNLVDLNQIPLSALSLGQLLFADINSPQAQAAGIPIPYPGFTGSVAQALRPYPQYQSINDINALVKTDLWHAGIFEVQKHFGSGLSFLATYTISKMLSNDPFPTCLASVCAGVPTSVQTSAFRGNGASELGGKGLVVGSPIGLGGDRAQTLNLSYTYELPLGRDKRFLGRANPILQTLVGGWMISGLQSYSSGTPFPILSGATALSASAGGFGAIASGIPTFGATWANLVPGQAVRTNVGCGDYNPRNPSKNQYLNPNAFAAPPLLTLGDVNILPNVRTCGAVNETFSLVKDFSIRERIGVKFGADFFNAFNRHQWYALQTNVSNPQSFGQYTAATDPRIIQLHMSVNF